MSELFCTFLSALLILSCEKHCCHFINNQNKLDCVFIFLGELCEWVVLVFSPAAFVSGTLGTFSSPYMEVTSEIAFLLGFCPPISSMEYFSHDYCSCLLLEFCFLFVHDVVYTICDFFFKRRVSRTDWMPSLHLYLAFSF